MTSHPFKRIAAISIVRNDDFFIPKWISYYGGMLGKKNLFLIMDGHDQGRPAGTKGLNLIRLPRIDQTRVSGDRDRSRLVSHLARALFHRYDIVIAHDIDEFLVLDPDTGQTLPEYLTEKSTHLSLSGLGLDVGQHLELEGPIDPSRPFLDQRSYAHVSARYTKSVVANRPLTWGSGFHRVKGHNFHIDPNLYVFHFGVVDYNRYKEKRADQSLLNEGWKGHLKRRHGLFDLILNSEALEGDGFFRTARRRQSLYRPLHAWNKPGKLKEKPVIKIPERFRTII